MEHIIGSILDVFGDIMSYTSVAALMALIIRRPMVRSFVGVALVLTACGQFFYLYLQAIAHFWFHSSMGWFFKVPLSLFSPLLVAGAAIRAGAWSSIGMTVLVLLWASAQFKIGEWAINSTSRKLKQRMEPNQIHRLPSNLNNKKSQMRLIPLFIPIILVIGCSSQHNEVQNSDSTASANAFDSVAVNAQAMEFARFGPILQRYNNDLARINIVAMPWNGDVVVVDSAFERMKRINAERKPYLDSSLHALGIICSALQNDHREHNSTWSNMANAYSGMETNEELQRRAQELGDTLLILWSAIRHDSDADKKQSALTSFKNYIRQYVALDSAVKASKNEGLRYSKAVSNALEPPQ